MNCACQAHVSVEKEKGKRKKIDFVNAHSVIFSYVFWTGMGEKKILQEPSKCLFFEYSSLNAWCILGDLLKFVYVWTSESKARREKANLVLWLEHRVSEVLRLPPNPTL